MADGVRKSERIVQVLVEEKRFAVANKRLVVSEREWCFLDRFELRSTVNLSDYFHRSNDIGAVRVCVVRSDKIIYVRVVLFSRLNC